jgi:hypothetical protein
LAALLPVLVHGGVALRRAELAVGGRRLVTPTSGVVTRQLRLLLLSRICVVVVDLLLLWGHGAAHLPHTNRKLFSCTRSCRFKNSIFRMRN